MKNSKDPSTGRKITGKRWYAILSGLIAYAVMGSAGLKLLLICWPAYAIAALDKSYSFGMLLSRLCVGICAAILAGVVTGKIEKNEKKNAWLVGMIVFCVAGYIHFFRVWNDYPAWYHFSYLLPIIPVIGLSHYLLVKGK